MNNSPDFPINSDFSLGAGTSKQLPIADMNYVSRSAALRILRLQDVTTVGEDPVGKGHNINEHGKPQRLQDSMQHDSPWLIDEPTLLRPNTSAHADGNLTQRNLLPQGTSSMLTQAGGLNLVSIPSPSQHPAATAWHKDEQSMSASDAPQGPPLPPYLCPGSDFLQDMSVLFKPWSPANNELQITVAAFMACTLNTEQLQLQQDSASQDPKTLMPQMGRLAQQALSIREQHKHLQAMAFPETPRHDQLKSLFKQLNSSQIDKYLMQEKLVLALIQLYGASQQTVPQADQVP